MATRSTISLEYADGTIGQIYCHWDSYLDNNGKILLAHYKDPFKVQKLLDQGDMSSLDCDVGEKHAFDKPVDGACTFYMRDRGETGCEARSFEDYGTYLAEGQREEYNYILRRDGNWYVEFGRTNGARVPLAEAIADLMIEEELEDE